MRDVGRVNDLRDKTGAYIEDERTKLVLEHDTKYYYTVTTENSAGNKGQTVMSMEIHTDHTIPPLGTLHNLDETSVEYTSNPYYVLPSWTGFVDPESGVYRYYLALRDEKYPNDFVIPYQEFTPDFSGTYWPTNLIAGHNYTVHMRTRNNAGLERHTVSQWFMYDSTRPNIRSVTMMDHWHLDTDYLSLDGIAARRGESCGYPA